MSAKRIIKRPELSLEEKYERWMAFASACYEYRFQIAVKLNRSRAWTKKKAGIALAVR
jgi:hypothetical protein